MRQRSIPFAVGCLAIGLVILTSTASAGKKKPAADASKDRPATTDDTSAVAAAPAARPDGAELFHREWLPNDPRSHGGDGLGPVFNDTSCVACHNQGGPGGGGPASKNADIITAFANDFERPQALQPSVPQSMFRALFGDVIPVPPPQIVVPEPAGAAAGSDAAARDPTARARQQKEALGKLHPGFLTARSVVLHKASTDPDYEPWRLRMLGLEHFVGPTRTFPSPGIPIVGDTVLLSDGVPNDAVAAPSQPTEDSEPQRRARALGEMSRVQSQLASRAFQGNQAHVDNFVFVRSQRNPTALFGVGLIDTIPDEVLVEQAKQQHSGFPEIQGRVARLKDGRIGRFGWKGQTATLYEFAMTACAVELGLDVPDHPQSGIPRKPDYKPAGHDLNQQECDALVDYLRHLPRPTERRPASAQEAEYLAAGRKHFEAVGCATCHTPNLGQVQGIYSDLLLHDMGPNLGDTGSYGVFIPNSADEALDEPLPNLAGSHREASRQLTRAEREKTIGALRQEWRTPPLWGVRDSGPYLHDGRAETLEEAIALHGGEAQRVAEQFFMLAPAERMQLIAFLKSLTAPEPPQVAAN
jgi:CxxC motif-containing protein (DUF1111 family)